MSAALDIAAVAKNVTRGNGEGRAMLELVRVLCDHGHRVTVYAHRVDEDLADRVTFRALSTAPGPPLVDTVATLARTSGQMRRRPHQVAIVLGPAGLPQCPFVYYAQFSFRGWRTTWGTGEVVRRRHRVTANVNAVLEHAVARRADVLLVPAAEVAQELVPGGHRHVAVVPNGVDPTEFVPASSAERAAARAHIGLDASAFVIGFAGEYLTGRKGLRPLIDAVATGPDDEHLVVAGNGPQAQLQTELQQRGLAGRVHLLGFADPRLLYGAADAVAVPSSYEPFSLVAVEAASAGLGVVVSACAGAAAYLNSTAVRLDEPGDPRTLRRSLDRVRTMLSSDPGLPERARAAAERLDWRITAAQAAAAVEELADRSTASRNGAR